MATDNSATKSAKSPSEPSPQSPGASGDRRQKIRVNGRFLLLLAITFLVLGAGLYGLHSFQMQRNAKTYLELATEAEESGDTKKAIEYLSQYLRFEPKDYDAKVRLANLIAPRTLDGRALARVLVLLEDVLRNDPDRSDADEIRRRAAELCQVLGKYREALGHIKILREERPRDGELLGLRGSCQVGLSEHRKAAESYLAAISTDKGTVDHYVTLIVLLKRRPETLPRRESLEALMSPAIAAELVALFPTQNAAPTKKDGKVTPKPVPTNAKPMTVDTVVDGLLAMLVTNGIPQYRAYLARAAYLLGQEDLPGVGKDLNTARKEAPDAPRVLLQSADFELLQADRAQQMYTAEARVRRFVDDADSFAVRGERLESPDNLPFFGLRVRIERLRISLADEDARKAIRDKALATTEEGLKAHDAFTNSPVKKEFDDLRLNLIRKRELLGMQAALLLELARRDDGSLDEQLMKQHAASVAKLRQLVAESDQRLRMTDAMVLLAQRRWRPAMERLSAIRRRLTPKSRLRRRVDLALAECYRQLRDMDGRLAVLRQGLAVDARWHEGRALLAETLLSQGKLKQSATEYGRLVNDYRIGQMIVPFVGVQIRQAAALPAAERTARLKSLETNVDKASQHFTDNKLDDSPIAILRAQLLEIDDRIPAAERHSRITQLLDAALKKSPDSAALWIARAKTEALLSAGRDRSPGIVSALKLLDRAPSKFPKRDEFRADLLSAKAEIASGLEAKDAAPHLKTILAQSKPLASNLRNPVLESVAKAYGTIGEFDRARTIWRQLGTSLPDNLGVHIAAATLAAMREDAQGLAQLVESIRSIEGRAGAWGNYFEARRLTVLAVSKLRDLQKELPKLAAAQRMVSRQATYRQLEEPLERARRMLQVATQLQPNRPDLHYELGRIAALRRNRRIAFQHFERAIILGDRSPRAFTFAVQYLFDEGRYKRADELLRLAAEVSPRLLESGTVNLADRSRSLSELAIQVAGARREFADARRYIDANAQDFRLKMLLSQIAFMEYSTLSETDKAGEQGKKLLTEAELARREAIKLAPKAPEPYIFAVVQLSRLKRVKEVAAVIDSAQRALPLDQKAATAGRCYAIIGDAKKAEAQFMEAVKAKPDDANLRLLLCRYYASQREFEKAEPHLRQLQNQKFAATAAQRAEAKHLSTLSVAAGGSYSDLLKALKSLEDPKTASLADLYTRAVLLQRSGLKRDRRALIDVLERIDQVRQLAVEDRFLLARLYARVDKWGNARAIIDDLLKSQPRNGRFLSWYAVASLQRQRGNSPGDVKRARELLARLRNAEPDEPRTAEVEARLLVHDNRPKEAETAILSCADRVIGERTKLPLARLVILRQLAQLSETLNLAPAAEHLWRRHARASSVPEDILRVATFLGRRARYSEGIAICRTARKTCKPLSVAIAAVNVVSLGRPSQADVKSAEELIKTVLKADPRSIQLRQVYAGLLTATGETSRAEATYREVLRDAPNDVSALNNLAWLLAMQSKNLNEALGLIDRAIRRAGSASVLLDTQGIVFTKLGRPKDAIQALQRALDEVDDSEIYLHLAQAKLAAGNKKGASESLSTAHERGLNIANLHRLEHPGYQAIIVALGKRTK